MLSLVLAILSKIELWIYIKSDENLCYPETQAEKGLCVCSAIVSTLEVFAVGMMNHCFRLRLGLQPTTASIAKAKNNCVKT